MNIILISPIPSDIGLCTISSQLKAKGHSVNLLFIPQMLQDCMKPLPEASVSMVGRFIADADIIGINGLSENYYKTARLVDDIKKVSKAPVVWGGIHATIRPQDCIKHADIVCVGEGEEAMVELAEGIAAGNKLRNIRSLLFGGDGDTLRPAELRPPVDLDSLHPLDYNLDTQYIIKGKKIRNVTEADFSGVFFAFSSRSCPFRCSYCCNAFMNEMYKGQKFCRQRSLDKTFAELHQVKSRFPACRKIWFNEADFLSGKDQERIDEFAKRYKAEINIPFAIWSNPAAVTEENIGSLRLSGLEGINIGTVTGSDDIQRKIYNRNALGSLYLSKAEIFKKHDIVIGYDIILCNVYENDDDIIKTIELMMKLPKPYVTFTHSLVYFPGTELYEKAVKDGVKDEHQHAGSYRKAVYKVFKFKGRSAYLNIVLSMMRGRARRVKLLGFDFDMYMLPDFVLKFLIKKPVVNFFNLLLPKQ